MKKLLITLMFIFLNAVSSQSVFADPDSIKYSFVCPTASGSGPKVLNHFGNYIAGYGTEYMNNIPKSPNPYFAGPISEGTNIPLNINAGSYINLSTNYAAATGKVSCNYASSTGFDPFSVAYFITNGRGGQIVSSTSNTVDIQMPEGFKRA